MSLLLLRHVSTLNRLSLLLLQALAGLNEAIEFISVICYVFVGTEIVMICLNWLGLASICTR